MEKKSIILVTGATGMVGSELVKSLRDEGYSNILTPGHAELDLCDLNRVDGYFSRFSPQYVFMVAAKVGGISAIAKDPVGFLEENMLMQFNLFKTCCKYKTRRNLFVSSSCVYPHFCPQPMKEEYVMSGVPESAVEGYALAKIAGMKLAEYYFRQFKMRTVTTILCNLYGANDTFDLSRACVLSALVKRICDAKEEGLSSIVLWGSGLARREFMYVTDAAKALVMLMNDEKACDWVNVGTGEDISIRDLAKNIASQVGFLGEINWDQSKPDGMPKKCMEIGKLSATGFRGQVSLDEGIRQTIIGYRKSKEAHERIATQ